ncbi:MAG: Uma2 family endonuclease [Hyphomicrobiales bacterium]|nr:Uma2 family endonuclease [Hyphomicrobiales bacterium]
MKTEPLKSPAMTVEEYLDWAVRQPRRYELLNGEPIAMAPERARHSYLKGMAHRALTDAIKHAKLPCIALPDGITVRINDHTAYEPDAAVLCGKAVKWDKMTLDAPMIVVEVNSPSSEGLDAGSKLTDYFSVDTIHHYLIVSPKRRVVVHYARAGDIIETRIVREGELRLDPPGLTLAFDELLPELPGDED